MPANSRRWTGISATQAKPDEIAYMRHALRLAARGLGRVAPNPSVGCVIVSRDGDIVGRGFTQPGGRPHAETEALRQAGENARGATAYVTLEPCAHHGKTPPCADALVASGVTRVVAAIVDPDPRVRGQGMKILQTGGVAITEGICAAEARALNAGFLKRIVHGRPLVALKIAQSADGYVADANGNSRWITSEEARRHGHLMRARFDAIMVGIGTVLHDDPLLTCRIAGLEGASPIRVVVDSRLRLPPESQLARTARETPVLVFTASDESAPQLNEMGVIIIRVGADDKGRPDIGAVMGELARRGLTRVLVEGGPSLHASLLMRREVDQIHLYRAPLLLGQGAKSATFGYESGGLEAAPRLQLLSRQTFGPDLLESFALRG